MWVRSPEGSLVNLAFVSVIEVDREGDVWLVTAYLGPSFSDWIVLGRYTTEAEAKKALERLHEGLESICWR